MALSKQLTNWLIVIYQLPQQAEDAGCVGVLRSTHHRGGKVGGTYAHTYTNHDDDMYYTIHNG
jgi:hypothetical protein